jgi:hypothetical protein
MKWRRHAIWAACLLAFAGALMLYDYTTRPRPDLASPREFYSAVERHLAACRAADFPQAYHEAASRVHERLTLVEFERQLRRDYQPVAAAERVEYGAVHRSGVQGDRALVDVYFISRAGEATGWIYALVFEEGDWKVDHGEPIPGWPAGQRLSGLEL